MHVDDHLLHRKPDTPGCQDCATRRNCLLGPLPLTALERMQPAIRSTRHHDQDLLAQEGVESRCAVVLKVGNAFAWRRGRLGRDQPIGVAGRGAVFGLSGLDGLPEPVTAIAAGPVRVCTIPLDALRSAAAEDPPFAEHLQLHVVRQFALYASWAEGVRVRGVVNQLAYHLLLLARTQGSAVLELPTHGALARLLGTARETVARAFGTLRAEGGIEARGQHQCEIRRDTLLRRLSTVEG